MTSETKATVEPSRESRTAATTAVKTRPAAARKALSKTTTGKAPAKKAAKPEDAKQKTRPLATRIDPGAVIKIKKGFDPDTFRLDSLKRAKYLANGEKTVAEYTTWCKKQDPKRDGRGFLYNLLRLELISIG